MALPQPLTPPLSPEPQSAGTTSSPAIGAAPQPGNAASSSPAAATIHPAVWRAGQLGQAASPVRSSGFARLDAELPGGGWPQGTLTELIAREAGIGELRLAVPLLRQLTREHRTVVLLAPPHIPYAPALSAFGIALEHLLIVQARHAADRLWAVEQTLRSGSFGALLAWLPQEKTRPDHLRRLQLAAQSARGQVFLFRSLAAQFEPSPAPLRLLLLPRPQQRLSVQILKRRGPVLAEPMLLDLPQPLAAIRLRHRPSPSQVPAQGGSLATVHAQHPGHRPVALH